MLTQVRGAIAECATDLPIRPYPCAGRDQGPSRATACGASKPWAPACRSTTGLHHAPFCQDGRAAIECRARQPPGGGPGETRRQTKKARQQWRAFLVHPSTSRTAARAIACIWRSAADCRRAVETAASGMGKLEVVCVVKNFTRYPKGRGSARHLRVRREACRRVPDAPPSPPRPLRPGDNGRAPCPASPTLRRHVPVRRAHDSLAVPRTGLP